MDFLTLIGLVVVVVVIGAIIQGISDGKKKQAMRNHVAPGSSFKATQELMGEGGQTGLLLDETRRKICLVDYNNGSIRKRFFDYRDILSSEIVEDGDAITQTVRTSQIGSALIGGALLGGVGAIIGGLSGKQRTRTKVKRVDFKIVVNDSKAPIHSIALLTHESKAGGLVHNAAMESANHWHALISVLIRRADAEDERADARSEAGGEAAAEAAAATGVSAQIRELAALRDDGLLTPEEFQAQKARVLNG